MSVGFSQESLESFDGVSINCLIAKVEEPKAIAILSHDLGGSAALYEELLSSLASANILLVLYDLRGHGESAGDPWYVGKFSHYLDDLDLLLARLNDRYPSLPLALLGEGLGALIAASFVESRQHLVTGLLLHRLPTDLPVSALQKKAVKSLGRWLPRQMLATEEFVECWFEGLATKPSNYQKISDELPIVSLQQIGDAIDYVKAKATEIQCPVLILQGKDTSTFNKKEIEDEFFSVSISYEKKWQDLPVENNQHPSVFMEAQHVDYWLPWLSERIANPPDTDESVSETI